MFTRGLPIDVTIDLLNKIPAEVRVKKFFRRFAASVYLKIGDLKNAREQIEAYLAKEPDDLGFRLNWISILQRQGDNDD